MTKQAGRAPGLALVLLAALAVAAPQAAAHGATPSREVDTRVLLDDDGNIGFGGCTHDPVAQCLPGMSNDAVDLLNLDVREAYLAGQPALQFRIVLQAADVKPDRSIRLTFTASGKAQTFDIGAKDGVSWGQSLEHPFDRLDGPTPVGDGHPVALDGWVLESKLGVKPGDELTDIALESFAGAADGDLMPGQWYASGQLVPHVPDDPSEAPDAVDGPAAGTYAIAGPATLLMVSASPSAVGLAHGAVTVSITVRNPLNVTSQFVTLVPTLPAGMSAALGPAGINLLPGTERVVSLTVGSAASDGQVNVTLTSDLDAFHVLPIAVKAAPPPANGTASTTLGVSGGKGGKDSPGPSGAFVAVALVGISLAMRRRRT